MIVFEPLVATLIGCVQRAILRPLFRRQKPTLVARALVPTVHERRPHVTIVHAIQRLVVLVAVVDVVLLEPLEIFV